MSGINFNDRPEAYTASRPGQNETIYVTNNAGGEFPVALSGFITLLEDVTYEVDTVVDLASGLIANGSNLIRGDGTNQIELDVTSAITVFTAVDNNQWYFDALTVEDNAATGDEPTLFDITIASPGFRQGALTFVNGTAIRDFINFGVVEDISRILMSESVWVSNCTFTTKNVMRQVFIDNLFDGRGGTPVDYYLEITADVFSPPNTPLQVIISRNEFQVQNSANPDRAALYISPLLFSGAIVTIAENILTGPDFALGRLFYRDIEGEITAYADSLNDPGNKTTLTTDQDYSADLSDGDVVNILRSENYHGGHTISDVTSTGFDIDHAFVQDDQRGTFHNGSLDHRDPRITARDNNGTENSRHIAAGYMTGDPQDSEVEIEDPNTWYDLVIDGFVDIPDCTERFALCDDGEAGEFIYLGGDEFKGRVSMIMSVYKDVGAVNDTYEFGISINDADPDTLTYYIHSELDVSTSIRQVIGNFAVVLDTNDKVKIQVRCIDDDDNLFISNAEINIMEAA